jgi:hypothetical protein
MPFAAAGAARSLTHDSEDGAQTVDLAVCLEGDTFGVRGYSAAFFLFGNGQRL